MNISVTIQKDCKSIKVTKKQGPTGGSAQEIYHMIPSKMLATVKEDCANTTNKIM
jgi:hypothetical protein